MSYECTVCGYESRVGIGICQHSVKHKNEFKKLVGRTDRDYQEVRDLIGPLYQDGEIEFDIEVARERIEKELPDEQRTLSEY